MKPLEACLGCEDPDSLYHCGVPGVLAWVDGKLVHGTVERCDACVRFPSDEAAKAALVAHIGEGVVFEQAAYELHCSSCHHEIVMPRGLSREATARLRAAFGRLHEDCAAGDDVCPVRDPGCDAPEDDEEDAPHCHDACETPPASCVELLARDAGDGFDIGDSWQSAGEVKQYVRLVAEVARKEAQRA